MGGYSIKSKQIQIDENLKILLDNHPDAMAISNLDGVILAINDKLAKIFGKNSEELIGTLGYDYIDVNVGKKRKKIIESIIKNKKSVELIDQERKRWWRTIFKPIFDNEGTVVKIAFYIQDITKERSAKEELKQSEIKSRAILDAIPDLMFILDKEGIFLDYSAEKEDLYLSPNIFLGKNVCDVLPKELAEKIMVFMKKSIDSSELQKFCYELPIKNDIHNYEARVISKGMNEILFIVHDITDSIRKTDEIKRTMNYLQNVIDSASEIIFTIGSDLKIKTWNRTAMKFTGYKKSRIIGNSIKQLDLFEYKDELLDYIQTVLKGKTAMLKEMTINTSFGMKKLLSISPSFIKDKSENVNEILFVCRDITYEKDSHGSLIFGKSYLISEPTNNTTVELFKGFLRRGNSGLFICRMDNEEIQKIFEDSTPKILKLTSDKDRKYQTTSSLNGLLNVIKDFTAKEKHSIILMDRIDYLIVNFSFEKVIKTLYEIDDIIEKEQCLMLLHINPSLVEKTQMVMLYEEFQKLPTQKIEDIQLEEAQFDILNYINAENNRNTLVTYTDIGKTYSISKVTAQKRIESLKNMGMVFSKKQGRSKILYITDKGKNLLHHRSII